MKSILRVLLLVFFFRGTQSYSITPPANDLCSGAADISSGAWFSGTNEETRFDCFDHHTGHCGAAQQGIDMCCGIQGIESSVWYSFTIPGSGTKQINVDFRNISCNPISFFGIITSLQGFVLDRVDGAGECLNPNLDVTKACFDLPNANNINGAMTFTATCGVKYFIELDTEKNSFSNCGADCSTASYTRHAVCTWEIRISSPDGLPLKETGMHLVQKGYDVEIEWSHTTQGNYSEYKIERRKYGQVPVLITEASKKDFEMYQGQFYYADRSLNEEGIYVYDLYGYSSEGKYDFLVQQEISVHFSDDHKLIIYPNPASGVFSIWLHGATGGHRIYSVFNSKGQKILQERHQDFMCQEINAGDWPAGVYSVIVSTDSRIYSEKIIIYH